MVAGGINRIGLVVQDLLSDGTQQAIDMRYSVFDGLRGIFLLLMMYSHTTTVLQSQLGTAINHHQLGFADAAHGFVFLSGLVIALYFMRVLRERGEEALAPLARRRILFIYKYHIGALIGLVVIANLLPQNAGRLGLLGQMDADEYLALIFLIHQPSFFDILPMYMVFIACTPFILRMFERGHAWSVLIASISLWLIAQTGIISALVSAIEWKISATSLDIRIGLFGLFAWQLIYIAGLMLGYFTFIGRFDVNILRGLPASFVKAMTAAFFGLLLFQRFLVDHPARFEELVENFINFHSKWNFSLFFLASVVAYGVLLAWLYVAGSHSSNRMISFAAQSFRTILNSRSLILLGQNSIQVFTYHLVVVYLLSPLPYLYSMSEIISFALLVASTFSLFAFAATWKWIMARSTLAFLR